MDRLVVVVGGGVFGAAASLELARRGWRVSILDPADLPAPGASSTDVSKVVRMDYGSDTFYHELGEASLVGWDRWNTDWPRPLYHEAGFLLLSDGPMEPGGYEYENRAVLEARGHDVLGMADPALASRLEHLSEDAARHGYYNPRGGWAESGAVVQKLLDLSIAHGAEIVRDGLSEIESTGSKVSGVTTVQGSFLPAHRVVLAAGAWTPVVAPWLGEHLWPVAQPVVHLGVEDPDAYRGDRFAPWAFDISRTGWYGFPALDNGHLKIGHHGPGRATPPDERGTVGPDHDEKVRGFLDRVFPDLGRAPIVYRRVCMYCDSFDGDLLIGAVPDREGVVVASGGSGHGFKFAPTLGSIVADAVEGTDNPWSHRFGWRDPGPQSTEEARYHDRSTEDRP